MAAEAHCQPLERFFSGRLTPYLSVHYCSTDPLRVYVKNGGTVSSGDIRISCKKDQLVTDKKTLRGGFAKYKAYADEQIDDFLEGVQKVL